MGSVSVSQACCKSEVLRFEVGRARPKREAKALGKKVKEKKRATPRQFDLEAA